MQIDEVRTDETALALPWLALRNECRVSKGGDGATLGCLHTTSLMTTRSARPARMLIEEGLRRSETLFEALSIHKDGPPRPLVGLWLPTRNSS